MIKKSKFGIQIVLTKILLKIPRIVLKKEFNKNPGIVKDIS